MLGWVNFSELTVSGKSFSGATNVPPFQGLLTQMLKAVNLPNVLPRRHQMNSCIKQMTEQPDIMIEKLKLKLIRLSSLSCCRSVQMLLGFSSLSAFAILLWHPHIIDNRKSMGFFNAVLCVNMGPNKALRRSSSNLLVRRVSCPTIWLSSLSELTENQSR